MVETKASSARPSLMAPDSLPSFTAVPPQARVHSNFVLLPAAARRLSTSGMKNSSASFTQGNTTGWPATAVILMVCACAGCRLRASIAAPAASVIFCSADIGSSLKVCRVTVWWRPSWRGGLCEFGLATVAEAEIVGVAEMLVQHGAGSIGIAGEHQIHQLAVLVHDADALFHQVTLHHAMAVAFGLVVQSALLFQQARGTAGGQQRGMEGFVQFAEFGQVLNRSAGEPQYVAVEPVIGGEDAGLPAVIATLDGEFQGGCLDDLPRQGDVGQVVAAHPADPEAPLVLDGHKALADQAGEGLTQRARTQPVAGFEVVDLQLGAGRVGTGDDVGADIPVCEFRQAARFGSQIPDIRFAPPLRHGITLRSGARRVNDKR